MSDLKRFDVGVCDQGDPVSEIVDGEFCRVGDVIAEVRRRISVTNTLPEQQLALTQLLEWIEGGER